MEYTVSGEKQTVDFDASGLQEIMQNIRTLISTVKGAVPYDRKLGIEISDLDQPTPISKARLTARIFELIHEYEPRVEVVSVSYEEDTYHGKLIPIVKFRMKGGSIS